MQVANFVNLTFTRRCSICSEVVIVGGYLTAPNAITVGDIQAFIQTETLSNRAIIKHCWPVTAFMQNCIIASLSIRVKV